MFLMLSRFIDGAAASSSGQQRLNNVDRTQIVLASTTKIESKKVLAEPSMYKHGVYGRHRDINQQVKQVILVQRSEMSQLVDGSSLRGSLFGKLIWKTKDLKSHMVFLRVERFYCQGFVFVFDFLKVGWTQMSDTHKSAFQCFFSRILRLIPK